MVQPAGLLGNCQEKMKVSDGVDSMDLWEYSPLCDISTYTSKEFKKERGLKKGDSLPLSLWSTFLSTRTPLAKLSFTIFHNYSDSFIWKFGWKQDHVAVRLTMVLMKMKTQIHDNHPMIIASWLTCLIIWATEHPLAVTLLQDPCSSTPLFLREIFL